MSLTATQLLTRTQAMMQQVDIRWRSQLAILLENIEALKADNSAWEETPAGKAIAYQLRDYRGAYLFSKLISEAFLPGHGFPVGVVNFNYLTADELEKRRAIKATQADPNEGEKAFLVVLKNCPAVICLQHYASMLQCRCGIGRKSISFLGHYAWQGTCQRAGAVRRSSYSVVLALS